jgi:hypothetical protein
MVECRFVTIAFDESYNGESSGKPIRVSSSDIFFEDFNGNVDCLGTLLFVEKKGRESAQSVYLEAEHLHLRQLKLIAESKP